MNAPVASPGLKDRMVTMGRGMLALVIVIAALALVENRGWDARPGGGLFALGFLLLAGTFGGQLAAFVGFPRLTGYLAVGVLAGPHGLGLLTPDDVGSLSLVNTLALALIALQAGAELTTQMLKRSFRSLMWACAGHILFIFTGMTLIFAGLTRFMGFADHLSFGAALAVGTVWGAMAVSKAATDAMAILAELRPKGPVTEYAVGVVILIDVFVLILFAISLQVAKVGLEPGASFSADEFAHLGMELFASVAAGTTFGLIIAFYFWAIGREKLLFTVVVGYGVTAFCAYFHYDTLLVFVVAGFVVMNLTRVGHELVHTTESISAAVMVVFFATAGAQLEIGALATAGPIAAALAFSRIGLTWIGSRFGHRMARDPEVVRKYGYTSFISQAGVTLGLAAIARETLPREIGDGIATLLIAVIGINELIGPVAFKIGLSKAGEVGKGLEEPAPEAGHGDEGTGEGAPAAGEANAKAPAKEGVDKIRAE